MPTIEIISFKSEKLEIKKNMFNIAIKEENRLKSHRWLFNRFLKRKKGVIIHLGNPILKDDKDDLFWAGDLIDWDFEATKEIFLPNFDKGETGANQMEKFKFIYDFQEEISELINIALKKSPINKASFLTDIQFGSENPKFIEIRVSEFWLLHNNKGLEWNTMYCFNLKNSSTLGSGC